MEFQETIELTALMIQAAVVTVTVLTLVETVVEGEIDKLVTHEGEVNCKLNPKPKTNTSVVKI